MLIYVLNSNGQPLMPCLPVVARLLLKQQKAKCIKRTPFTIKLNYQAKEYAQKLTLGIDTGSSKVGSAVINSNSQVIYMSEIQIRNDIADRLKQRANYRRNRRFRKTRYRKARWLNRKNSIKKDRFLPTMVSKIHSHLKEISFIKKILPISKIILETANFDPHALKNPSVLNNKWLYQKGLNYGFANIKAYVLNRDNHTCQHCKGKSKDSKLEVHHIIFRSQNGSDDTENLLTLCFTCHKKLHAGLITLKKLGKKKSELRHATQMNSIRLQLLRLLPTAQETFGFITKEHRQYLNLDKEHYYDAVAIANQDNFINSNTISFKTKNVLFKKCVADGDYQQSKGVRSEKIIPTGKIAGFRKFDKILYQNQNYFIQGRMSTGYAILTNIFGEKTNLKPIPKLLKFKKISARKSWIMEELKVA